jgi:hypothetical protein
MCESWTHLLDSDCTVDISVALERSTGRSIERCLPPFFFRGYPYTWFRSIPAPGSRLEVSSIFWLELIPFWFGGLVSLVTKKGMKSHDGHDG